MLTTSFLETEGVPVDGKVEATGISCEAAGSAPSGFLSSGANMIVSLRYRSES